MKDRQGLDSDSTGRLSARTDTGPARTNNCRPPSARGRTAPTNSRARRARTAVGAVDPETSTTKGEP